MEKEEIKLLLEKYYDATATVEEEQRLREALLSGDAGSEFETDRQLFEALEASAPAEKYPDTLDARLDTLVGRLDRRRRVVRRRRWAIFLQRLRCLSFSASPNLHFVAAMQSRKRWKRWLATSESLTMRKMPVRCFMLSMPIMKKPYRCTATLWRKPIALPLHRKLNWNGIIKLLMN